MEKVTMSVQELSAQMGISLPKAYELVKTPDFPTIRVGFDWPEFTIDAFYRQELQTVFYTLLHSFFLHNRFLFCADSPQCF
mgnify:CR=1 FL=1